ncbi:MAG TPA: histone deacetylase [Terriglobales bacterium]|nr:histone deacetylase [Terriglobales bacterium]
MGELIDLLKSLVGKRFPFRLVYSNEYWMFDTGKHVFPLQKYRLVYENLLAMGARKEDFLRPRPAPDEDLLLVHTARYVKHLKAGTLAPAEVQALELRFSPDLVRFALLSVGGTVLAARKALEDGLALHIGGGFHHAFPDHGEGFCMIHDVAIAIRRLQKDKLIERAMTVDCDVHQGNGTAAIFGPPESAHLGLPAGQPATAGRLGPAHEQAIHDGDVFTISLHQEKNYPAWKPPSSIDVNLPDGTGDKEYLAWLDQALSAGLRQFQPDLLCYLAGADPYQEDQLGGLALSLEGLKKRDLMLFRAARTHRIPVMVTFAGGYARKVEDTVTIHCNTVLAAKETFASGGKGD